jgi:hypothetical protein
MKIGVTPMTVLLVAVLLVGCAPRLTRGESSGLKWHVAELTTSERPATYIGYKSDGRVKVYRYVVVLEDNSGVGVNFGQVETTILARPGTRPTSRTQAVTSRLPANGQLRIPMADSTWLVVPQWFEGAARTLNDDPVARKVFKGLNDRGEPVKIAIEFHLESIPPR